MKILATLTRDDIRSLEIAYNKTICARQAMRPNAVPSYAPVSARDKFFREAIFAYADARYLQDYFWRDLARRHGVEEKDTGKMYVDFDAYKLLMKESDTERSRSVRP
jgi:hypothetical protein